MMKKNLLLVFLFLLGLSARATHIVGGEFQLRYLSGFNYTLILNLYFDDVNGNPAAEDQVIDAVIYEKGSNNIIATIQLNKRADEQVPYTNPDCAVGDLRTRKIIYAEDIELSARIFNNPAGYYVVWERCCRNNIITNINNPGGTGTVFFLEFPAVVSSSGAQFINSSPSFVTPTGDYACINQPFTFPFGATDADGDQLRYSFIRPLSGRTNQNQPTIFATQEPYPEVSWVAGYDRNSAIAPGMAIDANGLITVTPDKLGLFVFSVLCEEIRNGVVIGRVIRDFQIMVLDCPINDSPQVLVKEKDKVAFYASNDTIFLDLEAGKCVDVFVTDPNLNQRLSVAINAINFRLTDAVFSQPVQVNTNPGDSVQFELCWPECLASEGGEVPFVFDVIASDDGCSLPKRDTIRVTLIARLPPNNPPIFSTSLNGNATEVIVNETIDFSFLGIDTDNDSLCVEAIGRGFDLAALGVNFDPALGQGNVSGNFTWATSCAAVQDSINEFLVDFIITEKLKCESKQDTVTIKLVIKDEPTVLDEFLPANVFTPNNDGKNDVFVMPNLPDENCRYQFQKIDIYSRWGRKVFTSKDRSFSWDGADASPGVYYYAVDFKTIQYKGTITLLR